MEYNLTDINKIKLQFEINNKFDYEQIKKTFIDILKLENPQKDMYLTCAFASFNGESIKDIIPDIITLLEPKSYAWKLFRSLNEYYMDNLTFYEKKNGINCNEIKERDHIYYRDQLYKNNIDNNKFVLQPNKNIYDPGNKTYAEYNAIYNHLSNVYLLTNINIIVGTPPVIDTYSITFQPTAPALVNLVFNLVATNPMFIETTCYRLTVISGNIYKI